MAIYNLKKKTKKEGHNQARLCSMAQINFLAQRISRKGRSNSDLTAGRVGGTIMTIWTLTRAAARLHCFDRRFLDVIVDGIHWRCGLFDGKSDVRAMIQVD